MITKEYSIQIVNFITLGAGIKVQFWQTLLWSSLLHVYTQYAWSKVGSKKNFFFKEIMNFELRDLHEYGHALA